MVARGNRPVSYEIILAAMAIIIGEMVKSEMQPSVPAPISARKRKQVAQSGQLRRQYLAVYQSKLGVWLMRMRQRI